MSQANRFIIRVEAPFPQPRGRWFAVAGVRQRGHSICSAVVRVWANGEWKGDEGGLLLEFACRQRQLLAFKLEVPGIGTYSGAFEVTRFSCWGDNKGAVQFSFALQSTGSGVALGGFNSVE